MGVNVIQGAPRGKGRPKTSEALGTAHEAHRAMKVAKVYRGALVSRATTFALTDSDPKFVQWDSEDYDYYNIFDSGANTRLSVPYGVTWVQLFANVYFDTAGIGVRALVIRKNTTIPIANEGVAVSSENWKDAFNITTPELNVVGGTDYFELLVYQESGGNLNLLDTLTWFSLKVLE